MDFVEEFFFETFSEGFSVLEGEMILFPPWDVGEIVFFVGSSTTIRFGFELLDDLIVFV